MERNKSQRKLFDVEEGWREEWKDMPEYVQKDMKPIQKITVNFKTKDDVKLFKKIIGQNITYKTDSIWFPYEERYVPMTKIYIDEP